MKNFNEIMAVASAELTAGQKEFRETHQSILNAGNMAADCTVAFARNLKRMHESKLYEEAGFETFEDYTEGTMNIKKSQAYKYLTFADNEIFHSSGNLGITKLSLIAAAPADKQEELLTKVKEEAPSVKELKAQIVKLQKEKDGQSEKIKELKELAEEAEQEADENMKAANERAKDIAKLEKEIKELKSAEPKTKIETVEKTVTVEDKESKEKLKEANQQLKAKDELIKAKQAELEKLQKQAAVAGDEVFIKFKIRFNEFQNLGNEVLDLLAALNPELQEKMKKPLKDYIGGIKL